MKEASKVKRRKGAYRPGRGRYTITRKRCKQKRGGRSGSHVVSYTDHRGKKRSACHTSPKKAKRQISKIEKWLKSIVKEESLRRFVRECLIEAGQNIYSIGLQDSQQGRRPKLNDPQHVAGHDCGLTNFKQKEKGHSKARPFRSSKLNRKHR